MNGELLRTASHDVVIVGAGPVGLTLAALLGGHGWNVGVYETRQQPHGVPRAVHFDDEIARIFALAGIGSRLLDGIGEVGRDYDWQNAAGQTLVHFGLPDEGVQAWPVSVMFHQPALEGALADRLAELGSVGVHRGSTVTEVTDRGDDVAVTVAGDHGTRQVSARYVVGCDGPASRLRGAVGATLTDLGLVYDWLILDVVPHQDRVWRPQNLQVCDPRRPAAVVSAGPGRRRFEFMRLPHEKIEDLDGEDTAWRLLEPWGLSQSNADLERHVVHTFHAGWADRWRTGRLLIAGDAAHLLPPFAGQGMCSGIRDAANLAWKLDLLLRDAAPDTLLDTYPTERLGHLRHAVAMSVALGELICLADPLAAAERDRAMLAVGGRPELALPPLPEELLTEGVLYRPDGRLHSAAGRLSIQARVRCDGRYGRFDEVVGSGFTLLCRAGLPFGGVDWEPLDRLPVRVVRLGEDVEDVEGRYEAWMAGNGWLAVVIRPDFYVFGAAEAPGDVHPLCESLLSQLC